MVLRPLGHSDLPELQSVPGDDPAWTLLLRHPTARGSDPHAWIVEALRAMRRGTECCWTIRDRVSGTLLGSTRFLNVDRVNRRLEIGATWLVEEARGTGVNAQAKLLQLDHAFGVLCVERVHIQADVDNLRSRRAIEQLGATFEGVLRRHVLRPDGTMRDTAVYSIVADEWAALRPVLEARASEGIGIRPPCAPFMRMVQ